MKASKIMIVRHGEKPADKGVPKGVTYQGEKDTEALSVRGWQRAGALSVLFAPSYGPLQNTKLATPTKLIAPGVGPHSPSERSEQVISVLAGKIGLTIDTKYLKGDEKKVAKLAMKSDCIVLIAWEHTNIHFIANKIMGEPVVPQAWPEDRFDIVYVFDYDAITDSYVFSQVPQMVLSGDLPSVIALPKEPQA